jgi:hypothetical protein
MTTLVGLVARKGDPAVVLASDLTGTRESWQQRGDITIRKQTQMELQKINVDKNRQLAASTTGPIDLPLSEFFYDLLQGNLDFYKALKRGRLDELARLNIGRFEGRLWNPEHINSMLVAIRYSDNKDPELYTCWPLGRVEERPLLTAIGSGSDYALDYLVNELAGVVSRDLSLNHAIDLASEAIDRASTDVYTGGLDLVIVRKNGIYEYGPKIKDSITSGKRNSLEEAKKEQASINPQTK